MGLPGFVSSLALMWYAAIPLYYLEIDDKKKRKIFFISCIVYILFSMITGERGHQLICLISLAITVFVDMDRKVSVFKGIGVLILILVMLFVLNILFETRHVGIKNIASNLSAIIQNSFKKNIILETIGTFGETLFTPYLVVQGYGITFKPFFGECFVKSLLSAIPDVFGIFKNINNEAIFSKMLRSIHAIGGSFAGDLYYNFGSFYWLFSLVFGFIYAKFSNIFVFEVKNKYMNKIYLVFPVLTYSLWWVRDSIGDMTRLIIWYWIAFFIYKKIVKHQYTNEFVRGYYNDSKRKYIN